MSRGSKAPANAPADQQATRYVWRPSLCLGALCLMAVMGQPVIMGGGFARAVEAQHNIPNLSGYWARPEAPTIRVFQQPDAGPGPIANTDDTVVFKIGDFNNPILLPHAAEAVKAHGDYGRAGQVRYEPWALCLPVGVPHALNLAGPIQILQSKDQVTILYQRGQQIRRIDLNRDHPENLKPSWYGHSVGHYEGSDSLVVDTVAQDSRSEVDSFGTPKSQAIHIVERYTLSSDRQSIDIDFTVEDPNTFTTVWSAKANYVPVATRRNYTGTGDYQEKIASLICQENNRDSAGERTIPIDDTADY
ncbi:MAG: hypothetical protein V3S07_08420 [Micropepsaceae bacterium]